MLKSQLNLSSFTKQLLEQGIYKKSKPKQKENNTLSIKQLADWESNLIEKEKEVHFNDLRSFQLIKKEQELKEYSKVLQKQSKMLIQQKFEISEKMQKYTEILEEINQNKMVSDNYSTISNCPIKQSKSLLNLNDKKRNLSLAQCQSRIGSLLVKIKESSIGCRQMQQQNNSKSVYQKQPEEQIKFENYLYDILFNKPPRLQSKWINENDNTYSGRDSSRDQSKFNDQLFYNKINQELIKLKQLKQMFD